MVSVKPRNIKIILSVIVLVAVVGGFIIRRFLRPPKIRNVLIITMDTTRSDHLSCYGKYKNVTPNIDALAAEGILFKNAYSPISLTLPSHSTIMTGVYPPRHGVHNNLHYQLGDRNLTLAEILKENGFVTAAIIGTFVLDSRFGLDQGFDTYDDDFDGELKDLNISQRRGEETVEHAISWMQKHKDNPFFLFLHFYDPHMPYDPPEPFKSMIAHPYFAEIAYTDHCIGQVLKQLKDLELYDSTLIVIVADHGEMLGEHNEQTHGYFVYQGNIKVPLIFKVPGKNKGKIIDDIAGTVDITPTILSLLGIDIPSHAQGKDLSEYLVNNAMPQSEKRYLYCESLLPSKYGGNSLLGVITDRFKYIQTTRPELYDLIEDPMESENLVEQQPQQARILQEQLKQILEESVIESTEDDFELDTEALQKLESLGYVAGDIEEEFTFSQDKEDPKDLIGYHIEMSKIAGLIQSEEFDLAEQVIESLLTTEKPQTYSQLCKYMVTISKKKDDYQKAIIYLQKIIAIDPNETSAYIDYGRALLELKKTNEAAVQLLKAYQLQPDSAMNCSNIAKAYYDGGMLKKAIEFCHKALEVNPDFLLARTSLADTLLKINQIEPAVEHYHKVLQLQPNNLEAISALAWIHATSKNQKLFKPKEALRLALQGSQINDYQSAELLDTLAAAYACNSQFKEAIETAQKAMEIAQQQGLDALAGRINNRIGLYRSGQYLRQ